MEKRKHSEIDTEYDAAAVTSATMSREDGPASPMHEDVHQQPLLRGMEPILEPLKVCLDDDSSIEDGDEDMFDDDAFYFGDEDFAALMSHESMKRRASAPASAALANQSSLHPPLHHSASMFNDHIGIATASSSSTTALSSTSTGEFVSILGSIIVMVATNQHRKIDEKVLNSYVPKTGRRRHSVTRCFYPAFSPM
eukprot:scaffold2315_cov139-Skeletonema_menzelii.AAC.7